MTMPPPPGKPDLDQALKRLLQQAHDGLLALLTPELHWRGERSPELPAVARQADLVWEVEDGAGTRGLLHIELQTKHDPEMGERLAEYLIRLWRRDHLPVRSIVIFLRAIPRVPRAPFVLEWMGNEVLRCHYQVVRLWELSAERVLETPHVGLWPLAGLMANMSPELAVVAAERIAAAPLTRQEQSELVGLLALLAGNRLAPEVLLAVLGRNAVIEDLLRESGVAQLWLNQGRAEGRAEGIAEGESEGRAEGLRQGLQVALELRFGIVDDDLREAITRADLTTLEGTLAHIRTDTVEQIRQRLEPR